MRPTAASAASLALLATLAGGAAACGPSSTSSGSGAGAASSPTPMSPKDALQAGVPTPEHGSYLYTEQAGPLKVKGSADPTNKKQDISATQALDGGVTQTQEIMLIKPDIYAKTTLTGSKSALKGYETFPKGWQKVDPTKLTSQDLVQQMDIPDATDISSLLEGLVSAQGSAGSYTGVIDLTQSKDQTEVDSATVTALGAKAKTLPFTATLDAKGRITAFAMNIPAAGKSAAVDYKATVVYDSVPTLTAPTSTVPATTEEYSLLNG